MLGKIVVDELSVSVNGILRGARLAGYRGTVATRTHEHAACSRLRPMQEAASTTSVVALSRSSAITVWEYEQAGEKPSLPEHSSVIICCGADGSEEGSSPVPAGSCELDPTYAESKMVFLEEGMTVGIFGVVQPIMDVMLNPLIDQFQFLSIVSQHVMDKMPKVGLRIVQSAGTLCSYLFNARCRSSCTT